MENEFVKYYRKHKISPVKQEISDYNRHCLRRKNLYRQLGIPLLSLRKAKVLEVGAGGGYNSLPLFGWDIDHIDIIEPNETGREDIQRLFSEKGISKNKYRIIDKLIEDVKVTEKYDVIIAEGFIQHLDNSAQILEILDKFTHANSIIIITCSDEIGLYVEKIKRFIGNYLVRDIKDYNKKVEVLCDIYKEQLLNLGGMSRNAEDWVKDQMLNPMIHCEHCLTIEEAIKIYKDRYDILGCSQSIFVDYSWYKDIDYNYKQSYMEQYNKKKHMFLFAGQLEESIAEISVNKKLEMHVLKISNNLRIIEREDKWNLTEELVKEIMYLNDISKIKRLNEFNQEAVDMIKVILSGQQPELHKYQKFSQSFGKSQQYISFSRI